MHLHTPCSVLRAPCKCMRSMWATSCAEVKLQFDQALLCTLRYIGPASGIFSIFKVLSPTPVSFSNYLLFLKSSNSPAMGLPHQISPELQHRLVHDAKICKPIESETRSAQSHGAWCCTECSNSSVTPTPYIFEPQRYLTISLNYLYISIMVRLVVDLSLGFNFNLLLSPTWEVYGPV